VELHYEQSQFRLIILDNGKGLDRASSSPGHFGLQGMQERSGSIKAQLLIDGAPNQGTRVELIVPA
jgi:signal transduction histidine kinase